MIPIVPIILAIVAIHLIVGAVSVLWILIPLFFLARFMLFRRGFRPWTGRRVVVAQAGRAAPTPGCP